MFKKALSKKTQDVLAILGKEQFIKDFYLAGGTALALQLGHRKSIDLDFFTDEKFNPKKLIQKLSDLGRFVLTGESWGTVNGELNNVKISFLFYQHKLIKSTKNIYSIKIAHPVDIALMKITAIGSRGSKKDFIDLYFISQEILSLKKLFALLAEKFKKVKYEPYYLIRGLTYFKDADKEAMPYMFREASWDKIKRYSQKEAVKLVK